jgi:hypothetical protein
MRRIYVQGPRAIVVSTTRAAKMTNNLQSTSADARGIIEFDTIIIGAGVSGFAASTISTASA